MVLFEQHVLHERLGERPDSLIHFLVACLLFHPARRGWTDNDDLKNAHVCNNCTALSLIFEALYSLLFFFESILYVEQKQRQKYVLMKHRLPFS